MGCIVPCVQALGDCWLGPLVSSLIATSSFAIPLGWCCSWCWEGATSSLFLLVGVSWCWEGATSSFAILLGYKFQLLGRSYKFLWLLLCYSSWLQVPAGVGKELQVPLATSSFAILLGWCSTAWPLAAVGWSIGELFDCYIFLGQSSLVFQVLGFTSLC